jgi:hypothetical protein
LRFEKSASIFPGYTGLPDFPLYKHTKPGKNNQITIKYTKWPQNIPNGRNYTRIVHYKTLENLPKLGFLVRNYNIWQP